MPQLETLHELVVTLASDVAASVANTEKLFASLTAAHAQIAALMAQVAALEAAGTMPDLQPIIDVVTTADQSLKDATTKSVPP